MLAHKQGQSLLLRVNLATYEDMIVLMCMLGPSQELHSMNYATHRRAYEIAVQTFQKSK